MGDRKNNSMYELYGEYEETLKKANKVLRKRQEINRGIREKYKEPFKREDHQANVNDITNWNSMIRDLEEDMKLMEMYLDFEDRILLHRDYNNMKSMILNQKSYEGEIPFDILYDECVDGGMNAIYITEVKYEIAEILNEVLTERQCHIVNMLFWNKKTQYEIAKEIGITQQGVADSLERSLKKLSGNSKLCVLFKEFKEGCN